jgi:thiamine-phosphate pyrophosphorylase
VSVGSIRTRPSELFIVTDRCATNGRPLLAVVTEALEGVRAFRERSGVQPRVAVQLREKDLPVCELTEIAHRLRELTQKYQVRLFINDRIDVALCVEADGVQLGVTTVPVETARKFYPHLELGFSTHSVSELRHFATGVAACPDFAFFGPVFETPAKAGIIGAKGVHGLTEAAKCDTKIIAVGGISASNISDLLAAGCAGVACIREILFAPAPGQVTMRLLDEIWKYDEAAFRRISLT